MILWILVQFKDFLVVVFIITAVVTALATNVKKHTEIAVA